MQYGICRYGQRKLSVHVRHGSVRRTFLHDVGADDRFVVDVDHRTGNPPGLLCSSLRLNRCGFAYYNVLFRDFVGDVLSLKNLSEHGIQRLVLRIDGNDLAGVHVARFVDEQIAVFISQRLESVLY